MLRSGLWTSGFRRLYLRRTTTAHWRGAHLPLLSAHHCQLHRVLASVEAWIDPAIERIYVILDNLQTHRAYDVLLFSLAHPRWEFVFQPIKAAYLNLIEPWWKIHHSLAFAGGRFESWSEMETASHRATCYWNEHKHPFRWGTRKRHRVRHRLGVAIPPKQTQLTG